MDYIAQGHRFEEQNAYFKSHDGMDLDPTTATVETTANDIIHDRS